MWLKGRSMDIVDQDTGQVYYTCHSKYGGNTTVDNVMRYCKRHGYEIVKFDRDSKERRFVWVKKNEEN